MAGASPVVATTAGGLAEIVSEGGTGYTASPVTRARSPARSDGRPPPRPRSGGICSPLVRPSLARYDYRATVRPSSPMRPRGRLVILSLRNRAPQGSRPAGPTVCGPPVLRPWPATRRAATAQDTRCFLKGGHQPPVDAAAVWVWGPCGEFVDDSGHPHLRIGRTSRPVQSLAPAAMQATIGPAVQPAFGPLQPPPRVKSAEVSARSHSKSHGLSPA